VKVPESGWITRRRNGSAEMHFNGVGGYPHSTYRSAKSVKWTKSVDSCNLIVSAEKYQLETSLLFVKAN